MFQRPKKLLAGAAVACILAIPLWLKYAVPQTEKLPKDFHYEAEIFSLDNFYDEAKRKFHGEQISQTKFSYETVSQKGNNLTIKNVFDVHKMTGEKIFVVEREYGINAQTGRHVKGYGDKDRQGFLFAPRSLKKQDYVLWHINYDTPATMKFQKAENIHGLVVYRYESNFTADQTRDLTFLPGVPDVRGINLDVKLETWIEPVSGRMIKYEDHATAYYYDLKTRERLHPWNQFNNTYYNASVREQVRIARVEKAKIIFLEKIVPFFLAILAITFIYGRKELKEVRQSIFQGSKDIVGHSDILPKYVPIFIILIMILSIFMRYSFKPSPPKLIRVGIARWLSGTYFDKNIQGFKDGLKENGYKEKENIEFIEVNPEGDRKKHQGLIQFLIDKKVDLIYSLTTPGTLIAKGMTRDIPIIFSVVTYPVETGVIASLEKSENNLVGISNYVPVSRQYYVFEQIYPHTKIMAFAHRRDEPNSVFQYREFVELLRPRGIAVLDIAAIDLDDMRQQLEENINQIDSLYAACDTLIQEGGEDLVAKMANQYRKPFFTCNQDGVPQGALVGNVADHYTMGIKSAAKAALILKGKPPSSLLSEPPNQDHIMINKKTAATLGLSSPEDLLKMADEIIE